MLKAVIFDLDGVIIDSEPLHFETDKLVMRACGHELSDSDFNKYVGTTNALMWAELKEEYLLSRSLEELLEMQSRHKLELLQCFEGGSIPGVRELLKSLKEQNILRGIASSSPRSFIEAVVSKLDLGEYFSEVISGEEVENSKPCPDVFLKMAELLRVNPAECIVIEDSSHGVSAALAAGMKCIGFKNCNSGNQDLSMADAVVASISEIDSRLLKSLQAGRRILL